MELGGGEGGEGGGAGGLIGRCGGVKFLERGGF